MRRATITTEVFALAMTVALLTVFGGWPSAVQADVRLPKIFGDHMVLQQERPIRVFGWADKGESVTVEFNGKTATTDASDDGRWRIELPAMKAGAEPATLSVKGKNSIELKDVLLGEVWICSGQSNMEWSLNQSQNGKEEAAAADYPKIRLFNVPGHIRAPKPAEDTPGTWQLCAPNTVGGFSGVGYFFGRKLHKEAGVPVGLIGSNWGGTRIEPWTPPVGFEMVPELKDFTEQLKQNKQPAGATTIYNAMVHGMAPFGVRGAIWYQGESNGNEGESYYHKMCALIGGWRKVFENEDLEFYFVQLADFQNPTEDPAGGDGWAKLREAQRKTLTLPHTGMAVIIDIGNARDIHPRNKLDVGQRLALWALHGVHGQDVVPSGPLFREMKVEGSKARLSFDHVGGGLIVGQKNGIEPTAEVADGKLKRFAIAGEDKKWHWAETEIVAAKDGAKTGDTVLVWSADVPQPVAVRYAYSMNPAGANLYNKDGLPASPFRTDDW